MSRVLDKGQVMTTEDLKIFRMSTKEVEAFLGVEESTMDMSKEQIIQRTGVYGRRMLEYLEEHQNQKMLSWMLRGVMLPEVEKRVNKAKDRMMELEHSYLEKNLNSQMDYMTTVKVRNQARMMAEETALNEIIYQPI